MENVIDMRGKNWTPANLKTIINWVNFAAFMIEGLEESINIFRSKIRLNTILGLVLSTASGTISVAQYSEYVKNTGQLSLILNGVFTLFTFGIAIHTGYIKIYQIHERLELFIKTKQEWTSFVSNLSAELDLPIEIRKDALQLISTYREHYLNLMNVDYEMHAGVLENIENKMNLQIATLENKTNTASHNASPNACSSEGRLTIIRKTHGLKVHDMAFGEVESMIEFLENLYKLDSYKHDKEIKDIIKCEESTFMKNAYGKMPYVQQPNNVRYAEVLHPNTLTHVVVDAQNKIFNNEKLDSIYTSIETYTLERDILQENRIAFMSELGNNGTDLLTYNNSDQLYKEIELLNSNIDNYYTIFVGVCETLTYSNSYMDMLYDTYKKTHEIMSDPNTVQNIAFNKSRILYSYIETVLEIGSRKRKETFKKIYGEIMARKSSDE